MSKQIEALVNPQMLVWARQKSGFDINGAAKRLGVKSERMQAWENGETRPTINQAMRMAEIYRRPLSSFYLDEPPADFSVAMTDFRRLPDAEAGEFSPELIRELRRAETRRSIMLEFTNRDDGGKFSHLNTISLDNNPAKVAEHIRTLLGVSWTTQRKWYTPNDALNGWKEAIENLNVLVFHTRHQGKTLEPSEAHGFSFSEQRFPVIVINSRDAHQRRIFTLLHEFSHLLLNEGGVCDTWEYFRIQNTQQRIEVFCNHVAGAVLVPATLLLAHTIVRNRNHTSVWSDEEIAELAEDFFTSREVVVRRLLALDLTTPQFYERKRREYIQAWQERKELVKERRGGGPPYYRMVLRNNGKPFTRQVLHAYYDNEITLSDVSDYLDVKIKHVKRMERELFPMPTGA